MQVAKRWPLLKPHFLRDILKIEPRGSALKSQVQQHWRIQNIREQ